MLDEARCAIIMTLKNTVRRFLDSFPDSFQREIAIVDGTSSCKYARVHVRSLIFRFFSTGVLVKGSNYVKLDFITIFTSFLQKI